MAAAVGVERVSVKAEKCKEGSTVISEAEFERFRGRLRERWELASVLNFLNVFEPVIRMDQKVSAEDIETSLIKPDKLLSHLHIKLLKGIPPVSKTLNGSDAWVTVLCKKLGMWWPWVAEGEFPLTASKGEEMSKYKELDPTTRLRILKALCEIRADQDDTVSYINEAIKSGTQVSTFRKDQIGGDGDGTTYWYDGSAVTGHRLYKEVSKYETQNKVKRKGCLTIPSILCFQWETLATNLEEFRGVVDKFSSSENRMEVAVGESVENEAIPALVKLQKKKEMALKQKQRQEMLLDGIQHSYRDGYTRSCRSRKPVNYTYDDYDQAIKEAIQVSMKRKRSEGSQGEHKRRSKDASIAGSDADVSSRDCNEKLEGDCDHDDESDGDYNDKSDHINAEQTDSSGSSDKDHSLSETNKLLLPKDCFATKTVGLRWSTRIAEISSHSSAGAQNMGAKNRLRQRPTRNTALEYTVVPDSEDGNSSGSMCSGTLSGDSPSQAPDSEEVSHSH